MTDLNELLKPTETPVKLEDLVGEGKKFATVEDLAKGKLEADSFITKLTSELDELRKELETKTKELESKMNLESLLTKAGEAKPVVVPPQPEPKVETPNIEEIVQKALETSQARKVQADNEDKVVTRLTEEWGNDAPAKLKEVARNAGLSDQALMDLARTSPNAFFRIAGVEPVKTTQNPGMSVPKSTVVQTPSGPTVRNAKYYENLKNTDRKQYFSKDNQMQMYKDAMALGEAFFE